MTLFSELGRIENLQAPGRPRAATPSHSLIIPSGQLRCAQGP